MIYLVHKKGGKNSEPLSNWNEKEKNVTKNPLNFTQKWLTRTRRQLVAFFIRNNKKKTERERRKHT